MPTKYSIVEYYGERGFTRCGYCKGTESKINHGMWAHTLSCQDYEDLLNRGWRRSGKYCYKPIMNRTCCPQYTIRCDVNNIKLSKSQKKVIKRFNNYIATGRRPNYSNNDDIDISFDLKAGEIQPGVDKTVKDKHVPSVDIPTKDKPDKTSSSSNEKEIKTPKGADPSKPRCRKAKEMRRERKAQKLRSMGKDSIASNKNANKEKSIEDFINEIPENPKHKFEVKIVRCCPESEEFRRLYKTEYNLFKKYQMTIHKESESDSGEKQFRRFLVDGPLKPVTKEEDNETPLLGLGAFHQQYFIDDRLVAVGVLDILPHSVSSKYLFYDPDYSFLSLGTYTALREIYFVRSLHRESERLKYYYMGFYIHSCLKMKYKGHYDPSYLLCPETYNWQPIKECIPKLDVNKYSRLEDDSTTEPVTVDPNDTLVLYQNRIMTFSIYLSISRLDPEDIEVQTEEVNEYSTLTGTSASSLLLFRH